MNKPIQGPVQLRSQTCQCAKIASDPGTFQPIPFVKSIIQRTMTNQNIQEKWLPSVLLANRATDGHFFQVLIQYMNLASTNCNNFQKIKHKTKTQVPGRLIPSRLVPGFLIISCL